MSREVCKWSTWTMMLKSKRVCHLLRKDSLRFGPWSEERSKGLFYLFLNYLHEKAFCVSGWEEEEDSKLNFLLIHSICSSLVHCICPVLAKWNFSFKPRKAITTFLESNSESVWPACGILWNRTRTCHAMQGHFATKNRSLKNQVVFSQYPIQLKWNEVPVPSNPGKEERKWKTKLDKVCVVDWYCSWLGSIRSNFPIMSYPLVRGN